MDFEKAKGIEYFVKIGHAEREIVRGWLGFQRPLTKAQKTFLAWVEEALFIIDYDYRIASIEPSIDKDGNLYYKKGELVCSELTVKQWLKKAKEFYIDGGSDIATVYELYLWYAYRITQGYWSLNFICNNSGRHGNYKDSPGATHFLEVSGARRVGGASDGVGNTIKIVCDEPNFALCGGDYTVSGRKFPIADFAPGYNKDVSCQNSVGVLVLRK